MKKQRKTYSSDLKVKVALAAIKGLQTTNQIATLYGIHPHQVTQWKKHALAALPEARRERGAADEEALKAQLYQQIGQLKVELDWLKKKAGAFI